MTLSEILLVIYLLAVAVWYGGSLTGMLLGLQVRRGGDAQAFGRFCMSFAEVAGPLFGAAALLVLGTGIWMVALEGAPHFTDPWVIAVLVGWFVALVLGATGVGMSWTKIGTTLRGPDADLGAAAPLVARAVRLSTLDLALRTAIIVIMVWQPG